MFYVPSTDTHYLYVPLPGGCIVIKTSWIHTGEVGQVGVGRE